MLAPSPRPPSLLKRLTSALAPMPRAKPFSEMGSSGTTVYSGYVRTRERSAKWVGAQRYITIADMAVNTSIIAAGVHYFLNLVAHPSWTVKPAVEDDAEAEAAAELVESVLHGLSRPWSRVVRRSATYRFYGFSIQEWTAIRKPDGAIGLASIEPRPQHTIDRWAVSESGDVEGVYQRDVLTGKELAIPRSKLMYLVEDTLSDSPEGVGIFRHLAEPWERLKTYYDLEARAFERDLRGIPVGRVPYSLINAAVKDGAITKEKAAALVKTVEDFVQIAIKESNTGVTLDSAPYESQAADGAKVTGALQWGIELLSGGASGMGEVAGAIVRTQTEMARILTCEHLMMGESSGNRALAADKSRNLYLVANSVLTDIAAAVDRDVVARVCDLNGIAEDKRPYCEVEDVAFKDAEMVSTVLARMAQAGAVLAPDDPVVEDVRSLLGVSAPKPPMPEMLGLAAEPPTDEELAADDGDAVGEEGLVTGDEEVEKYNENHDEQGRFSSGDGGGGGGDSGGGTKGGKLSPTERSYLDNYSGDTFLALNQELRSGGGGGKAAAAINSAISKSPLEEGGMLYRGMSKDAFKRLIGGDEIKAGQVLNDKGFVSTTRDPNIAMMSGAIGGVMLHIQVGSGVKGVDMSPHSRNKHEKEVILGTKTPMRVLGIKAPKALGQPIIVRVIIGGGITKSDQPRTLYVKRRLLNGDAVRAWAAEQGIASALPADDMHVTVAFSKEPVDWSELTPQQGAIAVISSAGRAVHQFPARNTPNGAFVLKFTSPELTVRWQEFLDAGASWDFPEYQPHITITYTLAEADLAAIEPYHGPLVFGPEEFAEVNEGWAGEITEEPTGALVKYNENHDEAGRFSEGSGGGGGSDAERKLSSGTRIGSQGSAERFVQDSKLKSEFFHMTSAAKDIYSGGFEARGDDANEFPGVSFARSAADALAIVGVQDDTIRVRLKVRNPVEFGDAKVTARARQVFGVTTVTPGEFAEMAVRLGYDAVVSSGEVRVFDPRRIFIIWERKRSIPRARSRRAV